MIRKAKAITSGVGSETGPESCNWNAIFSRLNNRVIPGIIDYNLIAPQVAVSFPPGSTAAKGTLDITSLTSLSDRARL